LPSLNALLSAVASSSSTLSEVWLHHRQVFAKPVSLHNASLCLSHADSRRSMRVLVPVGNRPPEAIRRCGKRSAFVPAAFCQQGCRCQAAQVHVVHVAHSAFWSTA
jgi:hypothetical protein